MELMKKVLVFFICFSMMIDCVSIIIGNSDNIAGASELEDFQYYIYQAENYLDRVDVSEKLFEDISPSTTMYRAGVNSGLALSSVNWETFISFLETLDKPSSIEDKAFEKKDLYEGLIFSVLECEYNSDSIAEFDYKSINETNKIYKNLMTYFKGVDYIGVSESDKIKFSDLTIEQKENLFDYSKTLTNANGTLAESLMKDVDMAIGIMDTLSDIEEWCTYLENCIMISELNEYTKQLLNDMYTESLNTRNIDMQLAFKNCIDVAKQSELDLIATLTLKTLLELTKEGSQKILDTYWGAVKTTAQASNPYLAYIWIAYTGSTLLVKYLFNSDNISEKFCKLEAMVNIRDVVYNVYKTEKTKYNNSKTEDNAGIFISARNLMYQCISVDCDCAYDYVDSVDSGLLSEIKGLFSESNITKLKEQIYNIKSNVTGIYKAVSLNWVFWLQEDYPDKYETYKTLLNDYLPSVKLSETSKTLSVGKKIDLGWELMDPLNFMNEKIVESWTSSNRSVAIVNGMGNVSAVGKGTAIIRLKFLDENGKEIDGLYEECEITVTENALSITDVYAQWVLKKGLSYTKNVDIDNDTVPELLVIDISYYGIYKYSDGKVKKIKTLKVADNLRELYYNTKKHTFCMISHGSDWTYYYFYMLKGTRTTKIATYKMDTIFKGGTTTNKVRKYIINGKKVSESTFNKKFRKYIKGYKSIATANSKNKKVLSAYNIMLSSKSKLKTVTNWDAWDNAKFSVIDLNKDEVDELVVTPDDGYHVFMCAYINGNVKIFGDGFSGYEKYYPTKKIIMTSSAHSGYYSDLYYKFNGKKEILLCESQGSDALDENGKVIVRYKYYIKGKEVSKTEFRTYVSKILDGAKEEKIEYHKNNSSARKNYL